MSNTSQKYAARAANMTLSMYVENLVYSQQRGFVRGRSLLNNRLDIDATLISASVYGDPRCGAALFDIAAAFPILEWRWLFHTEVSRSGYVCFFVAFLSGAPPRLHSGDPPPESQSSSPAA